MHSLWPSPVASSSRKPISLITLTGFSHHMLNYWMCTILGHEVDCPCLGKSCLRNNSYQDFNEKQWKNYFWWRGSLFYSKRFLSQKIKTTATLIVETTQVVKSDFSVYRIRSLVKEVLIVPIENKNIFFFSFLNKGVIIWLCNGCRRLSS